VESVRDFLSLARVTAAAMGVFFVLRVTRFGNCDLLLVKEDGTCIPDLAFNLLS